MKIVSQILIGILFSTSLTAASFKGNGGDRLEIPNDIRSKSTKERAFYGVDVLKKNPRQDKKIVIDLLGLTSSELFIAERLEEARYIDIELFHEGQFLLGFSLNDVVTRYSPIKVAFSLELLKQHRLLARRWEDSQRDLFFFRTLKMKEAARKRNDYDILAEILATELLLSDSAMLFGGIFGERDEIWRELITLAEEKVPFRNALIQTLNTYYRNLMFVQELRWDGYSQGLETPSRQFWNLALSLLKTQRLPGNLIKENVLKVLATASWPHEFARRVHSAIVEKELADIDKDSFLEAMRSNPQALVQFRDILPDFVDFTSSNGALAFAKILTHYNGLTPREWQFVYEVLKKDIGNPRQYITQAIVISVLESQGDWPLEIWKLMPDLMTRGTLFDERETLKKMVSQREWPKGLGVGFAVNIPCDILLGKIGEALAESNLVKSQIEKP